MEIEKKFESISAWEGFVSVTSNNRKTVLTLARDSHKHRLDLEKLLEMLNLEALTSEIPDVIFNFQGMLDAEILQKIVEQDKILADLYTEIVEKTDPKLIEDLTGNDNVDFFYQMLDLIVGDEKRHLQMVNALVGTITRIL